MGADTLAWLDRHSGAVQAVATLVLVALTTAYVIVTSRISKSSAKQAQLVADTLGASERLARRSLPILAARLMALLHDVPAHPPPTAYNVRDITLWTDGDLVDLERIARAVPEVELDLASTAVEHLRWLAERIGEIRRHVDNPRSPTAFTWTNNVHDEWPPRRKLAEEALDALRTFEQRHG